jgi:hypothetical protein
MFLYLLITFVALVVIKLLPSPRKILLRCVRSLCPVRHCASHSGLLLLLLLRYKAKVGNRLVGGQGYKFPLGNVGWALKDFKGEAS